MPDLYPNRGAARDQWIVALRPARNEVVPHRPYAFLTEEERDENGKIVSVATIFLTNRECPWRCVMCDLWRNTLTDTVPPGAITAQLEFALERLPAARQIKLYNSGSFFDPRAIPPAEHNDLARLLRDFQRVIVECHPGFVDDRCLRFRDLLSGKLEIAMGLETAHPQALAKLNKRMTLDQFAAAAQFLVNNAIACRSFVLVNPPFVATGEAALWVRRSIDFACRCGSGVISLIPTRAGNGAMDVLAAGGEFTPPSLADLEAASAYGVALRSARVFADLWDLEMFSNCPACFDSRKARLHQMNLQQVVVPPISCTACGA